MLRVAHRYIESYCIGSVRRCRFLRKTDNLPRRVKHIVLYRGSKLLPRHIPLESRPPQPPRMSLANRYTQRPCSRNTCCCCSMPPMSRRSSPNHREHRVRGRCRWYRWSSPSRSRSLRPCSRHRVDCTRRRSTRFLCPCRSPQAYHSHLSQRLGKCRPGCSMPLHRSSKGTGCCHRSCPE